MTTQGYSDMWKDINKAKRAEEAEQVSEKMEAAAPVCTHSWSLPTFLFEDGKKITRYTCFVCREVRESVALHEGINASLAKSSVGCLHRWDEADRVTMVDAMIMNYTCSLCAEKMSVTFKELYECRDCEPAPEGKEFNLAALDRIIVEVQGLTYDVLASEPTFLNLKFWVDNISDIRAGGMPCDHTWREVSRDYIHNNLLSQHYVCSDCGETKDENNYATLTPDDPANPTGQATVDVQRYHGVVPCAERSHDWLMISSMTSNRCETLITKTYKCGVCNEIRELEAAMDPGTFDTWLKAHSDPSLLLGQCRGEPEDTIGKLVYDALPGEWKEAGRILLGEPELEMPCVEFTAEELEFVALNQLIHQAAARPIAKSEPVSYRPLAKCAELNLGQGPKYEPTKEARQALDDYNLTLGV